MSSAIRKLQNHPFFLPLGVSTLIILCWLIPLAAKKVRGIGYGAGIWGLFEIVALVATIIAPVVYGWKTGDSKGAVAVGVLPYLFMMIVPRIISEPHTMETGLFAKTILFIVSLCVIGGLEGFFASRREKKSLVVAIALAGIWIVVFLSGID